jgi:septin family protein
MYKGEVDEVVIRADQVRPKNELLYKILVIGELGTGKTSFIKRYVHQVSMLGSQFSAIYANFRRKKWRFSH